MNADELETVLAVLNRNNGHAHPGPRGAHNSGSGVPRPRELDSPDKAIAKDARAAYVKTMTDLCPVEQMSVEERREMLQCTRDVLEADGYFLNR